jgi:hypothetical protein
MWRICLLSILSALVFFSVHGQGAHAYDMTNLDNKYKDLTRENLAKLYWHMNTMDINNDTDIDNFVMINKCDLYQKYYHNDFVWHDIRNKARISIAKNKDSFSPYLRIIRQIYLGRYNPQMESYELQSPIETSNFEIRADDYRDWECKEQITGEEVWRYPHQAILELSTPVKMETVPVPSIVAFQYNTLFADGDQRKAAQYRPAYLVQDIKIYDANPFENEFNRRNAGTMSAVLESIHIYGDSDLTMLLYTQNIR